MVESNMTVWPTVSNAMIIANFKYKKIGLPDLPQVFEDAYGVEKLLCLRLGFDTQKYINKPAETILKDHQEFMATPARFYGG